jgi:uncharacterized protein (DUF697 family)
MNAKKLPKAIKRTTTRLHPVEAEQITTAPRAPRHDPEQPNEASSSLPSQLPSHHAESEPTPPQPRETPAPAAQTLALQEIPPAAHDTEQRRWLADRIVERYATYSAGGGFIPLPIANVASVVAINIRMVKALSGHYGVPFEKDRARAIVVGLAAGAMPTGLASVAASTLYLLSPASSIIALGVSSVTAAACTRTTGRFFIEHFESGAAAS